jgi:hypothetical protein
MIDRLKGLIVHPDITFREIAREPHFLLPWLLSSALLALPMIAAVHRIGPVRLFGPMVALVEINPDLADQPVEVLYGAVTRLFEIIVVVTPFVAIPLTAVSILPMLPILRGKAGFRPLMAVTAWAALPPAMGMFVTTMMVLAVSDPTKLTLGSLTPFDLGVLIPARISPLLHNILSTVEFFSAWSVYLLLEGIAAAAGVGFRRAFLWLALPLIAFTWIVAAVLSML